MQQKTSFDVENGMIAPVFDILQDLCKDSYCYKINRKMVKFGLVYWNRFVNMPERNSETKTASSSHCPVPKPIKRPNLVTHSITLNGRKTFGRMDNSETKNNWGQFIEELNNFIAGTENGSDDVALQCCMAALRILGMKGPVSLGVDIAGQVLEKPDISDRSKKHLSIARTRFLRISGRMNEARGDRTRKRERQRNLSVDIPLETEALEKSESVEEQIEVVEVESMLETTITEDVDIPKEKSLGITEQEHEDLQLEADDLLEQGNIEEAESYYGQALEFYNKAMELYKRIGRTRGIIEVHQMIGNVYRNQGDYDKATTEFETSLQLSDEHSLFLFGCSLWIGTSVHDTGEYPKAIEYLNQSLDTAQQIGDKFREELGWEWSIKILDNTKTLSNTTNKHWRYLSKSETRVTKESISEKLQISIKISHNTKTLSHITNKPLRFKTNQNKRSEGQILGNLIVINVLGNTTRLSNTAKLQRLQKNRRQRVKVSISEIWEVSIKILESTKNVWRITNKHWR